MELFSDFYEVDKVSLLSTKSLEQRLSGVDINYDKIYSFDVYLEKALRYLTKLGFGLFSFISGEKISPSIKYDTKTNQSYCSLIKNHINIGLKLLLDENIDKQTRVDILIAIQLHELFHKRFTISAIAKMYNLDRKNYYDYQKKNPFFKEIFNSHKLFPIISNIYEDRRIELLGTNMFPGYIFYFEKARKYALELHSNPSYWYFNPGNKQFYLPIEYLKIKILLPEYENEFLKLLENSKDEFTPQLTSLPIYDTDKYLEFINLYTNNFSKEVIETIFKIKSFLELSENKKLIISKKFDDVIYLTNETIKLIPENLQDQIEQMQINQDSISIFSDEFEEEVSDAQLQESGIDEILERVISEAKNIEQEEENITEVEEEIKFLEVVGNVNNAYDKVTIINPINTIKDEDLYLKAKQDSKQIKIYLDFLNSKFNRDIEIFQLEEGDIDEAELYSIKYRKDIFFVDEEVEDYELDIGILLDESGSMAKIIELAKLAVLTIALGLENNKRINLFIYGHTSNINGNPIEMFKYYNSLENIRNINTIFSAKARGNNADGYAILKLGEIMLKSKCKNKVLIVASDGYPNAFGYTGIKAMEHTKECVDFLATKGILVIQLCMNNLKNSDKMFKHIIPFSKNKNFAFQLKSILLKELHKISKSL